MRRPSILLGIALAALWNPGAAQAQIQPLDSYQQTVYREMRRYEAQFNLDAPTHHIFVSSLAGGQTQSVTVDLEAGTTYAILGVCDEDCSDLDLRLYGANGLIDSDVAMDDFPIVRVTTTQSGTFRIEVVMASCSVDPCRYGLGVYEN